MSLTEAIAAFREAVLIEGSAGQKSMNRKVHAAAMAHAKAPIYKSAHSDEFHPARVAAGDAWRRVFYSAEAKRAARRKRIVPQSEIGA